MCLTVQYCQAQHFLYVQSVMFAYTLRFSCLNIPQCNFYDLCVAFRIVYLLWDVFCIVLCMHCSGLSSVRQCRHEGNARIHDAHCRIELDCIDL